MPELTLSDLVRNRTMSPSIAATLAVAAEERRSLLFIAIPRHAGKTTTMEATLAHVPPGTPLHDLDEAHGDDLGIPTEGDGGYLRMAEISQAPMTNYLWGDPVRRAFAALERGFALVTALHAAGVDEAFEVITRSNAVPDEQAARIDLAVYIATVGDDWRAPERRAVADVREIDQVVEGRPIGRALHRWHEDSDTFEDLEPAVLIGSSPGRREELFAFFSDA
jgi:hypothetical protein